MYRIGNAELKRIERLFKGGKIFRYGGGGECDRFEEAWSARLGVKYCKMTTSGTSAIYAALVGLKVGPGDEVIVPACTYMATALAVLSAGAIPVVADIDDSITLCPKDFERRIGPRTKAVIPVHMWGLPCDLRAIRRVARKHKILVLEDACQAVGGGYEGKPLGSWGHAGAFSFNFYKNMTSGEGGAFVTNSKQVVGRGSVAVDCCQYYWNPGEENPDEQFAGLNFRATEISGAILNAQLKRIDPMLNRMRGHKKLLLEVGLKAGLKSIQNNSIDYECGTHLGFQFSSESDATQFTHGLREGKVGSMVPINTGRHVYTRWDPILRKQGAHHPALDPYRLPENRKCRKTYKKDMCKRSLDIMRRTVLIPMHPDNKAGRVREMSKAIREAAA